MVDSGYNNVVFKANEYLFEKILGTLVAISRLLMLDAGTECLHLFLVRSYWIDDGVVIGVVSASAKMEVVPPRSPTRNRAGPSKSIGCVGSPVISCRFAGFQY